MPVVCLVVISSVKETRAGLRGWRVSGELLLHTRRSGAGSFAQRPGGGEAASTWTSGWVAAPGTAARSSAVSLLPQVPGTPWAP